MVKCIVVVVEYVLLKINVFLRIQYHVLLVNCVNIIQLLKHTIAYTNHQDIHVVAMPVPIDNGLCPTDVYNICCGDWCCSIEEGCCTDGVNDFCCGYPPTPSTTPSLSITPSETPSITPSETASVTPTPSESVSATPSVTNSLSITPTITPTISISVTPTVTPTISITPTVTPTKTVTPTPSKSPCLSFGTYIYEYCVGTSLYYVLADGSCGSFDQLQSSCSEFCNCPSVTPSPTKTPTKTPTVTPTKTPSITPTKSPVSPSTTPSITPTKSPVSPSTTPSITPTQSPVAPSVTPTKTPSLTPSPCACRNYQITNNDVVTRGYFYSVCATGTPTSGFLAAGATTTKCSCTSSVGWQGGSYGPITDIGACAGS